ncbi:hypothetical protein [Bradyrhizobium sp. URHD0069]|uniref:hypothetical protein n=1 Tax=Bradyrhizobium sp. URHD0069 TaxID=1380355 RepID=UPI00049851D2|nr:hypothetical protein [Bradyrhizobium sp. URHD0069]
MLKEMIEQADVETGGSGLRKLNYVADGVGMATSIGELVTEAVYLASRSGAWSAAGIAVGTVGVLAQYVGVWLTIGGAHADAMSAIAKDHLARGISYGVVLGANGAKPNYAYDNFWLQAPPILPFYREFEKKAQNLQNSGLVVGYSEGKQLSPDEMRTFFDDIMARMSEVDQEIYDYKSTPWKEWSADKKRDFYSTAAAIFRRDHLE